MLKIFYRKRGACELDAKEQVLLNRAREMRHHMTKEECHLWFDFLQTFPLRVHRQKVFAPYIVDFYIAEKKLVIEVDGTQHYLEEGQAYDEARDDHLRGLGLTILRFGNNEINKEFEGVCQAIWTACFGEE